jgi:hypothetical protein
LVDEAAARRQLSERRQSHWNVSCDKQARASAPAAPFQLHSGKPVQLLEAIDHKYLNIAWSSKRSGQPD